MMNNSILIWLFLLPLIIGCGKSGGSSATEPPGSGVEWSYEKDAIVLDIRSDEHLNQRDDNSHTLALCIHQLSGPDSFSEFSGTPTGVLALLKCDRFDESVSGYKRIIVQPGEDRTLFLDRGEHARFIGISAGYFDVSPAQATRLFDIPVDVRKEGWVPFFRDTKRTPGRLKINLLLGPQEIQDIEGN